MICINLLPSEEVKAVQFRQRRIPIVPVLFMLLLFIAMAWSVQMIRIVRFKAIIASNLAVMDALQEKKKEVDLVWNAVNNELKNKERFLSKRLARSVEWAHVLNIISESASQSIWLDNLDVQFKDGVWILTISGFAKPIQNRSMIKDIGEFVTGVKQNVESLLMVEKISKKADIKDRVEVSTTTKRMQADNIELTEFSTVLKIIV